MKKLLLGLGTIAAVAAPVAAIVACSSGASSTFDYKGKNGTKVSISFRKKGYSITANFNVRGAEKRLHLETISDKFSENDIDKWTKLQKADFLIDNYNGEMTPELKEELIGQVNYGQTISWNSDVVEDVFVAHEEREGRETYSVLGTGANALTSFTDKTLLRMVSESDIEGMKNFVITHDPEIKRYTKIIYLEDDMNIGDVTERLAPIDKLCDGFDSVLKPTNGLPLKVAREEYVQLHMTGKKFLIIYNGKSDVFDLADYYSKRLQYDYSKSLPYPFEASVNNLISSIDGVKPGYKLFRDIK